MEILVAIMTGAFSLLSLLFSINSNNKMVEIKQEHMKELENVKHLLQQEIEKLKSELEKERMELNHQFELEKIKSSAIYQKRMEAIIAINANIMDVYLSLKKYVSIVDNCSEYHEERRKKAAEKIKLFWKEYNYSRIILPDKVDNKITDFINKLMKEGLSYMVNVEYSRNGTETVDKWNEIDENICELWNTLFVDIREEFRKILGVNED